VGYNQLNYFGSLLRDVANNISDTQKAMSKVNDKLVKGLNFLPKDIKDYLNKVEQEATLFEHQLKQLQRL